jgi:hypothetical protein
METTTPEITRQAAILARRGAGKKEYGAVALFDLNEDHLKKYTEADFETILNVF